MSDRSSSLSHSLCSQGPIVNPLEIGGTQRSKTHKQAANWSDEETTALLKFLIRELSKASDGGNFKKTTWTAAASLMST
ncbi:hypothetical protein PAXRUDRAFT_167172 [Paxillus rubicundulus Ve08.2h10]|uniref:Myb/SANT-like domain-containing protein n=1 Tax=Paxillus rubicundulus Ve08.2h10 TaxID=930991 RepID=A0A0D0DA26_9AGAM|nr:hypothetical protein PAXRUDRAFT_167172 [Paxillus rubicundulus Ve08.2h10]